MSFLLFFTSIYACHKLYIFKTNGLYNIFSANSPFIVVISCTVSSLLNNFTIVSSYLHAILMNEIPFVKNKNYVPQAWVWTVKIYEAWKTEDFCYFSQSSQFSWKGGFKPHMDFLLLSFIFSDDYYYIVIQDIFLMYQYLHRLEFFLWVDFQWIYKSCIARMIVYCFLCSQYIFNYNSFLLLVLV